MGLARHQRLLIQVEGEEGRADNGNMAEYPLNAKLPGSMVYPQDDSILLVRALVWGRHESVNKHFKHFKCIFSTFCHDIGFRGQCFCAVVVLTQLALCHGKPLWMVHMYADPYDVAWQVDITGTDLSGQWS